MRETDFSSQFVHPVAATMPRLCQDAKNLFCMRYNLSAHLRSQSTGGARAVSYSAVYLPRTKIYGGITRVPSTR